MAVTPSNIGTTTLPDGTRSTTCALTFSGAYDARGDALTASQLGLGRIAGINIHPVIADVAGDIPSPVPGATPTYGVPIASWTFEWDDRYQRVRVFSVNPTTGAATHFSGSFSPTMPTTTCTAAGP